MKKKRIFSVITLIAALVLAGAFTACSDSGGETQYRIVKETDSSGPTRNYFYDAGGSLIMLEFRDASDVITGITDYTNDSAGRRTKAEYYDDVSRTQKLEIDEYEYENGVLKKCDYKRWDGSDFLLDFYEVYTFSNGKKMKTEGFFADNTPDYRILFEYDSSGGRTGSRVENYNGSMWVPGLIRTRIYDSNGLLLRVDHSSGIKKTFEWEEGKTTHNYDNYWGY